MKKQLETMNKIIDNLDNIRLELKQKALVNGDTKCARMEHELKEQIMELISVQAVINGLDEFLDNNEVLYSKGALHHEIKKLNNK